MNKSFTLLLAILVGCVLSINAQTTSIFTYTGSIQTYTVPTGVTSVTVDARGACGGMVDYYCYYYAGTYRSRGGYGARVVCSLAVSSGQVLYVFVGGNGDSANWYGYCGGGTPGTGAGGWNGGGSGTIYGGGGFYGGGGGGGASDIRTGGTAYTDRLIVAGAGGGAGFDCATFNYDRGGNGGGLTGENGYTCNSYYAAYCGAGGGPSGGGAGATGGGVPAYAGLPGGLGVGGNGSPIYYYGGGGGGAGYYGGGGGFYGGGGGGSSYTDPTLATAVTHTQGYNTTLADTVFITVNCSGGVITGSTAICSGSTTALSDTAGAGAGTWISSSTSVATVGSSTGVVTGVSGGTTVVTYSVLSRCGFVQAVDTIMVSTVPNAILGTKVLCKGDTTALSDAVTGGVWTSSNTAIATVGSAGVVTGVSAGIAIITYNTGVGVSCIAIAAVTVNPLPLPISGTPFVCAGLTTMLSDASGGGTWSGGSTAVATIASSGLVTGIGAGATIITYSFISTGCNVSQVVTVNPLPSVITGVTSICIGATTSLFDFGTGTWSSSNTSVATISSSTGLATGVAAGTSSITYTLPTGCIMTTTLTVNPYPAPITGVMGVCPGLTTTLSDATAGGTWSSSNTSVADVGLTTGVVIGYIGGNTSIITYTSSFGCIVMATVTVNPLPSTVYGPPDICIGSTGTFIDPTGGGGTWTSSSTSVTTIGLTSGIAAGITLGTATITYTLPVTGCMTTTSVVVDPLPAPISGPTVICVGTINTLSDASGPGTWSIFPPGVAILGSTTGVLIGTAVGTATATYTAPSGCKATTVITVTSGPASISGTLSVCVGATTALTDAGGGTWSSSNTVIATIGLSTGIATGMSLGTSIITYSTGSGCFTTKVLTVYPLPSAISGNTSICPGFTTTLSDAGGGKWSSSNTSVAAIGSVSGIVTGGISGTATVTYTLSTGCMNTVTVTVNPLPVSIAGRFTLCVGSSAILSDATAGGTWSSSNTGIASIVSATGTVSGIAAGTATITYKLTATGCGITQPVTVYPLPGTIGGTPDMCVGRTTTLSDAGGGTWLSGTTTIATIGAGSGVVTGISAGTASITYTLATGCTANITVTVHPLPSAIGGPSAVCAGASVGLTGVGGGNWSSSNTSVATISPTGTLSGVVIGTATITYTLPTGCLTTTTITVSPAPSSISGNMGVCAGATTALSNTVTGGSWTSGNTVVASIGFTSGLVNGLTSGTSSITYSLGTGCTVYATVTVNPAPGIINGANSLCVGSSIVLTDATPGGAWSSSNTVVAAIGSTGVVLGNIAGTAIISYAVPTGCYAVKAVTVNPLPAAISGTPNICVGATTTLSNSVTGGNWTSGTTTVAIIGGTSGTLLGIAAGTSIVTYSIGGGCNVTIVATVNPLPAVITGITVICNSATTTLSSGPAGGTWSSSNTSVATIAATGLVTGMSPGTTTVTYNNGCSITTNVSVTPIPSTITGVTSICQASSTTLSNAVAGGAWSSSSSTVATVGASSGIVAGLIPGTATITYMVGASCTTTKIVTVNPVSPVIGPSSVCVGLTATMSDALGGGTWISSNPGVAAIGLTSGFVSSSLIGTTVISYTIPASGCVVTKSLTINSTPLAITGTAPVCPGANISLTDPIAGGTWTSSNSAIAVIGASSGVVTGVSGGSATITYSLGFGCLATTVVPVNPAPVISGGTANICNGAAATLSSASGSGTWSSSNTSVAVISAAGTITSVSVGTTMITYRLISTGCIATKTVSINTTPLPITGTTTLCAGNATTLTDPTAGGIWSSSNTAVASVTSVGTVNGLSGGTTTVTYSLSGCPALTTVTVTPPPTAIYGITPLCVGNSLTLSSTVGGGVWSTGSPAIATINPVTGLLNGLSSGTVAISYSISTGCSTVNTIIINPSSPITGNNIVCIGQPTTLVDTTLIGSWSSASAAVVTVGAGTGVVTGKIAGIATITYTTSKGCASYFPVTVNPVPAAINGGPYICLGQTLNVSDAVPGGTWLSTNASVADFTAPLVISGFVTGTSVISYTAGGCAATKVMSVVPLPSPVSSADVCVGTTTTLSAPAGSWTSMSSSIATVGAASGSVLGVAPGAAIIVYTAATGCSANTTVTVNPVPSFIIGPSGLCQGVIISLSDATSGGSWSSTIPAIASVDIFGNVTGNSNGSTVIKYTLSTGCEADKPVNVNSLPSGITGPTDVCIGQVINMSDATALGTWSSGNTTIAAVNPVTGTVAGIATGLAQIDYTIGTGCSVSTIINVNSLPSPITGFTQVCTGNTTTLNDPTFGGGWSSTNTAIATIDPFGTVTGVNPGTATVSYTMSLTGCVASTTMSVSPQPSTISGTLNICLGSSYTFSDVISGGAWVSTNPSSATVTGTGANTANVTGTNLGPATLIYTLPAGCAASVAVNVVPLPNVYLTTGGGSYCSDSAGVHVGLNGSTTGTNYFLYLSGKVATGPVAGTGGVLDFGVQSVSGAYTVIATSAATACSNYMSGSAVITSIPIVKPSVTISGTPGDSICNGVTDALTAVIKNGGTSPLYSWDVNGTIVGAGMSYSFIPANGDVVTFKLTSDAACARPAVVSNAMKVKVILPQTPSAVLLATPGDTICDGMNVTITPIPTYGGTAPVYTWMKNGYFAGTGASFTYVPVKGDVVYCKMTSNYSCLVAGAATVKSNMLALTVDTPLIPHVSISANPGTSVALGQQVTLTANVTDGGANPTFQWFVDGLAVPGATGNTYVSNQYPMDHEDSVSCVVTSSSMCTITTHQWVYISVHNVGVQQVNAGDADINVLPNPNKGSFVIKGTVGGNRDEAVSLEITDLLGQVVYKNNVVAKGGVINEHISLGASLANGMYLLNVHTEAGNNVFHIVVEQ